MILQAFLCFCSCHPYFHLLFFLNTKVFLRIIRCFESPDLKLLLTFKQCFINFPYTSKWISKPQLKSQTEICLFEYLDSFFMIIRYLKDMWWVKKQRFLWLLTFSRICTKYRTNLSKILFFFWWLDSSVKKKKASLNNFFYQII